MVKIFLRFNKLFFRGESPHASKNVSGAKEKNFGSPLLFPLSASGGDFFRALKYGKSGEEEEEKEERKKGKAGRRR